MRMKRDCWLLGVLDRLVVLWYKYAMMSASWRTSAQCVNCAAIVATISGKVTLMKMDKGKVLKLTNVLYALEFKQNIISISKIIYKDKQQ